MRKEIVQEEFGQKRTFSGKLRLLVALSGIFTAICSALLGLKYFNNSIYYWAFLILLIPIYTHVNEYTFQKFDTSGKIDKRALFVAAQFIFWVSAFLVLT